MSRRLTVVFAGFEALLVAAIGVAIPLLLATLMWAISFGFAPDWAIFWRASVEVWLVGHGVDVTFALDELTAATIGAPAGTVVIVTIAALGFALLTLALGVRAGARVAETGHRMLGELTAFLVFGAASLLLTLSAVHPAARPSIWQGALLPALVFGVGLVLGVLRADADRGVEVHGLLARWTASWNPRVRAGIAAAVKAGAASVMLVVLVSAVTATIVLAAGYAQVIRLYETLHSEVLGGIVLTAGQFAFVPNVVIWVASWFAGPGFALGAGSQVSPLGTAVGPLPSIPLLGALPSGELSFGYVGLAVPVVAAFLAATAVRPALMRAIGDGSRLVWSAFVAVGGGVAGGLLFGLLAGMSAGGLGPGRFAEVGPDALAVGLASALEFAIGLALGFAAASLPARLRR
ncbi:MAG: cell division protein PerM [Protaetiibacter sp.]